MARRPLSESYQSASGCADVRTVGLEDEDDGAPIFSLSRSSMDVVMATGPPHKRDPAWTTMDMRRSSSTNTHPDSHLVALKQLPPHMWQHMNVTNSHHMPLAAQNLDVSSSPVLSERWITNVQRWSQCSSSTHSRSSTPDTIVGREMPSQSSSLPQDIPFSAAPDSLVSDPMSPSTKPSSLASPSQTPNLPPDVLLSSSPLIASPGHQKDFLPPTSSPLVSPRQGHTSSPLLSNSLLQLAATEDGGELENNSLRAFTFPSPILSSASLADGDESSDNRGLADDATAELQSPESSHIPESAETSNMVGDLSYSMPNCPAITESLTSSSSRALPWELGQSSRSPLICSASDSQLGKCCRCNTNTEESVAKAPRSGVFREEGTMTSQPQLVDAEVQTMTPTGSLWGLRKNISNPNMGSHSFLGSPPGSRLNLKSSVGSNSNLVSPSSSMFPISSEEEEEDKSEDEQAEEILHNPDRRRSCLKNQGEDREDVRRGSMKQVQWDEDGMTWDIHGASPDPKDLSTAIQKHLELVKSNPTVKHGSKKKKNTPKPPVTSNLVESPEHRSPSGVDTEAAERKREETPDRGRKADQGGGAKMEEVTESDGRLSRSESDARAEELEGSGPPMSPSQGSTQITRKRSVIRSLRRPGWCLGSRKIDD